MKKLFFVSITLLITFSFLSSCEFIKDGLDRAGEKEYVPEINFGTTPLGSVYGNAAGQTPLMGLIDRNLDKIYVDSFNYLMVFDLLNPDVMSDGKWRLNDQDIRGEFEWTYLENLDYNLPITDERYMIIRGNRKAFGRGTCFNRYDRFSSKPDDFLFSWTSLQDFSVPSPGTSMVITRWEKMMAATRSGRGCTGKETEKEIPVELCVAPR